MEPRGDAPRGNRRNTSPCRSAQAIDSARRKSPRQTHHRNQMIMKAVLCAFFFWVFANAAFAQSARKPNVIFILVDDMGYADLSSFGSKDIRTLLYDPAVAAGRIPDWREKRRLQACRSSRCGAQCRTGRAIRF